MQKTHYAIVCIALCAICFIAGSIGPGRRADGLENRVNEITGQLDESLELVGALRKENDRLVGISAELNAENQHLRKVITELQQINERINGIITGIHDANSDTRQGIAEAEAGVRSVEKGIDGYIKEATVPE